MNFGNVLSIRSFRDLWLGQLISQLGDSFYYVAFMFMVKKLTGSDEMVGYVAAMETLPFLLFGPYSGVVADRFDRRNVMLWSDIISGAVLVAMAMMFLLKVPPAPWLLMALAFTLSSIRSFFLPAKTAAIPMLVPPAQTLNANALSTATQNMAPLAGLALSAGAMSLLYNAAPEQFYTIVMAVNASSFFLSAVFIALLPRLVPDHIAKAEAPPRSRPLHEFMEGFRYVRTRRDLTVLILLLAIFRLTVAPFFVVYVAANEKWFDGQPSNLAIWEMSFFLGMIGGSALAAKFPPKRPGLNFALCLSVVGITVGLMGVLPNYWAFILCNVAAGLAVPPADVPINTYMQLSVPDQFRGRTSSVLAMIATGVMPLGAVMGGTLIKWIGIGGTFLAMGLGMMAACAIGVIDPHFRNIRMPDVEPAEPTPASGDDSANMSECPPHALASTKAEKVTTSAPSSSPHAT
ncbi:MAG: MFS transporter [Fimbriimonadaceae bacterium]|nr:MFS transporter [Fimbriimonadaceae bacterium]